jgi:hypothetical protein
MITPIFKLDSHEKWRPQPVETVERFGKIGGAAIDLSTLPAAGGRMDFPGDMKDPADTPIVGYHRAVEGAFLWWHQFWLWFLYNPWEIAGIGKHEGDWEFVQLGCVDQAGDKPVLMTASQHHNGEKREFWRCELNGKRPVIYAALGSHANYFTPGNRGTDKADGRGKLLDAIEWRDFDPAWQSWPGLWGNSTGEGHSPNSPGSQGTRWRAPHLYHGTAT